MKNYKDILYEQLAADYCCRPEDVADAKNHFTTYQQKCKGEIKQIGIYCVLSGAEVMD